MEASKQSVFKLPLSKKQHNFPASLESSAATACVADKSLRICQGCRLSATLQKQASLPMNDRWHSVVNVISSSVRQSPALIF